MSHQQHHKQKNKDFSIRPMPLYWMLVCGIIITIAGIYLYSTDHIAGGLTHPVRGHGYTKVILNGAATIVLGLGICIFPAYGLIRTMLRKNQES